MSKFAAFFKTRVCQDRLWPKRIRCGLKQGPGVDKVEAPCGACHSLDYIVMNAPFLSAAQWDAEVAKRIKAYGAPIESAEAKTVGDYIKENYGG